MMPLSGFSSDSGSPGLPGFCLKLISPGVGHLRLMFQGGHICPLLVEVCPRLRNLRKHILDPVKRE